MLVSGFSRLARLSVEKRLLQELPEDPTGATATGPVPHSNIPDEGLCGEVTPSVDSLEAPTTSPQAPLGAPTPRRGASVAGTAAPSTCSVAAWVPEPAGFDRLGTCAVDGLPVIKTSAGHRKTGSKQGTRKVAGKSLPTGSGCK